MYWLWEIIIKLSEYFFPHCRQSNQSRNWDLFNLHFTAYSEWTDRDWTKTTNITFFHFSTAHFLQYRSPWWQACCSRLLLTCKQINPQVCQPTTLKAHFSSSTFALPVSDLSAVVLPLCHCLVQKSVHVQTIWSFHLLLLTDLLLCPLPPAGPGSLHTASFLMKNCLVTTSLSVCDPQLCSQSTTKFWSAAGIPSAPRASVSCASLTAPTRCKTPTCTDAAWQHSK